MSKSNTLTYRGHKITEVEEKGWSDSQQRWVHNGFRVRVDGPHYCTTFQTYCGVGPYLYRAIDEAIAKTEVAS